MINIQNAPNVPDPQGFSQLGQILNNPNAFNDLTGLNQNQLNAIDALKTNAQAAQQYAANAMALSNQAANYDLAKRQQMMQGVDNFMGTLDKLKKNGTLTPEQANERANEYLQKMLGTDGKKGGIAENLLAQLSENNKGLPFSKVNIKGSDGISISAETATNDANTNDNATEGNANEEDAFVDALTQDAYDWAGGDAGDATNIA